MSLSRFNLAPNEVVDAAQIALIGLSLYLGRGWHKSKRENERLHYEATHDQLTGVLNTRGFEELLDENKPPRAMLCVDTTNLKSVNDTLGYSRGDGAIIETVAVLKRSLRPSDIIARTGGDEFWVLLDTERRNEGKDPLSPADLLASVIPRIGEETQVSLEGENNLDLVEAGFNIAVGGMTSQEGMSIRDIKLGAEKNMKRAKHKQHQTVGQYRSITLPVIIKTDTAS